MAIDANALGNRSKWLVPGEFTAVSKEQQSQETRVALIPCSLLAERNLSVQDKRRNRLCPLHPRKEATPHIQVGPPKSGVVRDFFPTTPTFHAIYAEWPCDTGCRCESAYS
jgi:hypothetical protein